jgi:chromate reductase, NAD(P)H dehydrogenase (quinone)
MTDRGTTVLGISGSLRRDSHNTSLLRAAAELLPPGAELEMAEIADLPLYSEDLDSDPPPAAVARLRDQIARADAVVISTPEYNASIPGGLKNAIDWASRPFPDHAFKDKPVLVIGASTGLFGAVWAQAEVRKVLDHIGADVIDSELPIGQAHESIHDSELAEQTAATELERQLAVLVALARDLVAQPAAA